MADLPDGIDEKTAPMVIAWEMVKQYGLSPTQFNNREEYLAALVDAYNRVRRAITEIKPLAPKAG